MDTFDIVTAEDCTACLNHRSEIIDTAAGPMEYADRGQGPVLLAVHGGPGGYDQGLGIGEVFRKNGFRVIAVSRPGYLGTPLEVGRTMEAQADALAAFLNAMDISQAAVLGCSAGGPPSYQLAQRHPDRVAALIEIDSVSLKYLKQQEMSPIEEKLYLSRPGLWLIDFLMHHFPAKAVENFLKTESTLKGHELKQRVREIVADADKLAFFDFLFKTMSKDYARRKAGLDNDMKILFGIDRLPLADIRCPSLILHGDADSDVPYSHGEYAHQAIAGSELYTISGGSHIGFWVADVAHDAQAHAVRWLKDNVANQ